MSLTFTDIFCGAGGSSIGLTEAGLELRLAANHWQRAIETHAANFRNAEHLCADVNNYDMRRLPRTDVLWASPICTEASPAGGRGGRRRGMPGQETLEAFGHVPQAGYERTRATFHDVIRATEVHRYRAVLVENVPDVATAWELFPWWCQGMGSLGYRMQIVCVSSAHIGGQGNEHAPQWRDRMYLVFTAQGIPEPDVAPRPLAWCPVCETDVHAAQWWKPRTLRVLGQPVGKYRAQYRYQCPKGHAYVEPYVLAAAAAIDWSDLGTRIGDRPKPLAEATQARIRAGLAMLAEPVLVSVNHDNGDRRSLPALRSPLPTRTAKIGDGLLVPIGNWNTTPTPTGEPMRTRLANPKGFEALAIPPACVVEMRRNCTAAPVADPFSTLTTSGNHHYLTVASDAFYIKNYSGHPASKAKPISDPLGAMVANGAHHHSLVVPYRKGSAKTVGEPLLTMATRDSAAIATPTITDADVEDCRFRMLQPREQLRAQRFPDTYTVTGNRGEQTKQAGNAVSANVAHWLGAAITAALT